MELYSNSKPPFQILTVGTASGLHGQAAATPVGEEERSVTGSVSTHLNKIMGSCAMFWDPQCRPRNATRRSAKEVSTRCLKTMTKNKPDDRHCPLTIFRHLTSKNYIIALAIKLGGLIEYRKLSKLSKSRGVTTSIMTLELRYFSE